MTALITFRDHARLMAARHAPDLLPEPGGRCQTGEHEHCLIGSASCPCQCHDSARPVVPTDRERELWTRLANEIDEYLAGPGEHVDLFGDTTPEPERRLCDPPPPGQEPPSMPTLCDPEPR